MIYCIFTNCLYMGILHVCQMNPTVVHIVYNIYNIIYTMVYCIMLYIMIYTMIYCIALEQLKPAYICRQFRGNIGSINILKTVTS